MTFVRQKVLERILLPMGDAATRSTVMKELRGLRDACLLSEAALAELQKERLGHLLQHASEKSPYYRDLRITPSDDPEQWLKRFPILEKTVVRSLQRNMLTEPTRHLTEISSSGSTGYQTSVYWNSHKQSRFRATQLLWWEWAGYSMGDPMLQTGITPKRGRLKRLKDLVLPTYYLQAFSHSEKEVLKALRYMRAKRRRILGGYASSLYVIAKIARKNGIADLEFKGAISWGDKMFDHYRKTIEEVFNTRVYENYGSAEGFTIAAQYDLDYMYIMSPNVYLELVDDHGNEVPDGTLGHVVVTNLFGYAMPMIRYRIGDLAIKLPKEAYPANRKLALPLLQKVIGRDTDIVKTKSGQYMVVHAFTGIFEHVQEIEQFRVVQKSYDGIIIEYIPGKGFRKDILDSIERQIAHQLKEPFAVTFREVKEIPATNSGKPQLIALEIRD